jgi:N-methylhydantoinase A
LEIRLMSQYVFAMDVGGTFLDAVVMDDAGGVTTSKVLSTHDDYARCVRAAVESVSRKLGLSDKEFLARCRLIINGTTVATNVLAELRGPKVGLLTTQGFGDTLYTARVHRWGEIDLSQLRALPQIVPRERIAEIRERIDRKGQIVVPLAESAVEDAVRALIEKNGVEAIAVSFLWSFVNPAHEQLVARVIRRLYPDVPVSLSSEVFPAIREYERTNTTVIDAFLAPGVRRYLDGLEEYLRGNGFTGALRLVHAAGGVSTPDEVRRAPVSLINSGPVAGYVGAMKFGSRAGRRNIITADVGGTSFDTGVIRDGRLTLRHRTSVPAPGHPSPGYLTGLSMMDVSAIGTGGGSIGWVDARGIIRVGPRSAGSNPGPACFGRGGSEPTLTDACVVLGLLDPEHFLGGSQKLDAEAARRAVRANLMEPLGLPDESQAAAAMYQLALADMANNVRRMSIEKGYDPREFSLLCYGGAGGLFLAAACALASVPEMIVPQNCAVFSALGALLSDYRRTALRSCPWRLSGDSHMIAEALDALEAKVMQNVRDAGLSENAIRLERSADMRFVGQSSEISVPLPEGPVEKGFAAALRTNFRAEYARAFGAAAFWADAEPEVVNLRVTAVAPSTVEMRPGTATSEAVRPAGMRRVFWPFDMASSDWSVRDRAGITPGSALAGPLIVESSDTTIVIPAGCTARADESGNLVIRIPEQGLAASQREAAEQENAYGS